MSQAEIVFHNTLSGKKEIFEPANPEHVTIYVCGPTVYNFMHIGNARPAVVFDVLTRLLRTRYPQVTYVSNITDIDDKINAAAAENGEDITTLAERYALAYEEDISALGVRAPDVVPKATHHIAEIVDMIEILIGKGHAYANEGHVLFHVPSDPEYGSLAKRSLEDMIDGARVEVADYKKDPKDFVLWKPSTADQPGWESPWGRGRPGWHIECSAMVKKHLGDTIDIHGGGSDLTFPHHENEAAQSRCANDHSTYVRYWLHNGMLNLGTEKMSKSLGNFTTVEDVLADYPGEAVRFALLAAHYRAPLDFSRLAVAEAKTALDGLYRAIGHAGDDRSEPDEGVMTALGDDLNTPNAIARLHELAREANKGDAAAAARLKASAGLLGLLEADPDAWFRGGDGLDEAAIQKAIEARLNARKERNFAEADRIRDDLANQGILLEDTAEGTVWRRG